MSKVINIAEVSAQTISLDEAKSMVLFHKGESYEFFDEGCSRYTYANKQCTKVIKIEKNNLQHFNNLEYEIYQNASEEVKLQMTETFLVNGYIEQEFVMPIKFAGKKLTIPERLFANSCRGEVGWTTDGRLLCFDLDEYKKY